MESLDSSNHAQKHEKKPLTMDYVNEKYALLETAVAQRKMNERTNKKMKPKEFLKRKPFFNAFYVCFDSLPI